MNPQITKISNSEIQSQSYSLAEPNKVGAIIPQGTTMLLSVYVNDEKCVIFANNDMEVFHEIAVSDWDNCK